MGEFAIKVSPFGGEYGGGALRGKDTSCGGGSVNHYSFGVQTNSEMGATHYSFVVQTTIGL